MNIAICDDEENVRIYIRKLIEKQGVRCRIMEFESGSGLLRFLNRGNERQIDLLFLDISMEDIDGMAVARQLRSRMENRGEPIWGSLPLLIFVSGYPEYMPEAFSVNAFQYLVKPIRESDFEEVFAQALREYRHLEAWKAAEPREILVQNGNTTRNVLVDDIYYIESCNRKVIVHMRDEETECYGKISKLENELKADFFRIHRGYLVNMKYVERYNRTEVRMKNSDSLLISKYKYQDFVKAYLEYISGEK